MKELTYHWEGDYLIPDLEDPEAPKIGKYGRMRHKYLRSHHRGIFDGMLLEGSLNAHLEEIDRQANEMMERLTNHPDGPARRRHRSPESKRPNGLDPGHEQHPQPRRGNCPPRSDLCISNFREPEVREYAVFVVLTVQRYAFQCFDRSRMVDSSMVSSTTQVV